MFFNLVVLNSEGNVIDQFVSRYANVLNFLTSITKTYGDDVSVKISRYR